MQPSHEDKIGWFDYVVGTLGLLAWVCMTTCPLWAPYIGVQL